MDLKARYIILSAVIVMLALAYVYEDDFFEAGNRPKVDVSTSIEGQKNIQRYCQVYKYNRLWGDVDCEGRAFKDIERRCDVLFEGGSLMKGNLQCRKPMKWVEDICIVWMKNAKVGELACTVRYKSHINRIIEDRYPEMVN